MRTAILLILLLIPVSNITAQRGAPGLRMLPIEELAVKADAIVRGRIKKIEKANYLGNYTQLATLEVSDVIKGDSRLKEVKIWAGSKLNNAVDFYAKGSEVLVFLEREQTFFYTFNYQHGIFTIESDTVKNWRVPVEGPPDSPPAAPPNGNTGTEGNSSNPPESASSESSEIEYLLVDKSYADARKEVETYLKLKIKS